MVSLIIVMSWVKARYFGVEITLTTLSFLMWLALSSPPKVRVTSPTKVVGVELRNMFHVCDNLSVEWACVSVMRIAISNTSRIIHMLYHLK